MEVIEEKCVDLLSQTSEKREDKEGEIWVDLTAHGIPGYSVSNLGNFKTNLTNHRNKNYKPTAGANVTVGCTVNGKHKIKTLAELVLNAFREPVDQTIYTFIHEDYDHSNNKLSNLSWTTKEDKKLRMKLRAAENNKPVDTDQEQWKHLDFLKCHGYFVSSLGRVYNAVRAAFLNPQPKESGYIPVTLNKKQMYLHQWVGLAFLGPPPTSEHTIDHVERDKNDNRATMLRWATPSEQVCNTIITEATTRLVISTDPELNEEEWKSSKIAAEHYEVTEHSIADACRTGKNINGIYFRYADTDDLDGEVWKTLLVNDIEIKVSNLGRVECLGGRRTFGCLHNCYRQVFVNGSSYRVHRLIAEAFIGHIPDDMVVDHKDGIKDNNHKDNLQIITHQENILRAQIGSKNVVPVERIDQAGNVIKWYPTMKAASDDANVSYTGIIKVCSGKQKSTSIKGTLEKTYWRRVADDNKSSDN